jgi:hypothetical protein
MPDSSPLCPRCGDALPTAGHGPVACRPWARAEAKRLADRLRARIPAL